MAAEGRTAALFSIQDEIGGLFVDARRNARHQRSRPIVDDLHRFLKAHGRQVSAGRWRGAPLRASALEWTYPIT